MIAKFEVDKSIKPQNNQQNLQIIGEMQLNYFDVYSPHPVQVCYH